VLTVEESFERASELTDAIDRVRRSAHAGKATWDDVVKAIERAIEFPCTMHHYDPTDVFDEYYQALRHAGRYDEAIAAKYRAIDVGYRSTPHPEADVAECLLLLGRREEADELFAELRRLTGHDEYLYNSAGWAYAEVGDHETALRWLRAGIDVVLANGDYDRLADQLLEMAQRSLSALGRAPDDELTRRVRAFEAQWSRPKVPSRSFGGTPPPVVRCEVCEFDPAALTPAPTPARAPLAVVRSPAEASQVAVAWFDRECWSLAIERRPHLLDEHPADHRDYSRGLERRLRDMARESPGLRLFVSPLPIDELGDPADHAAAAVRVLDEGGAIPWPPARNDPCWCRSGAKYKRCCGTV
jgi:tetratricopeptide (TPR) repeat protein